MPETVLSGVSVTDFWKLTPGELIRLIESINKRRAEREKHEIRCALYSAYYGAGLSRASRFPKSITQAFPELFGRTEDGQIKAENWRESEAAMHRIAAKYNRGKGGGDD